MKYCPIDNKIIRNIKTAYQDPYGNKYCSRKCHTVRLMFTKEELDILINAGNIRASKTPKEKTEFYREMSVANNGWKR